MTRKMSFAYYTLTSGWKHLSVTVSFRNRGLLLIAKLNAEMNSSLFSFQSKVITWKMDINPRSNREECHCVVSV